MASDSLLARKKERLYANRRNGTTRKLAGPGGPWRYRPERDGDGFVVHDDKLKRQLLDQEIRKTPGLTLWLERLPN